MAARVLCDPRTVLQEKSILASPKGLPDESSQFPPADGEAFCMKNYRSPDPARTRGKAASFSRSFYGLKFFGRKTEQWQRYALLNQKRFDTYRPQWCTSQ